MKASLILNPRYWPLWFGAGLLFLCAQLPYRWQMAMGRSLGRIALPFAHHRRHVTETNLKLCFPTLSQQELKRLLKKCFESAGMGIFETVIAWWMPTYRVKKLFSLEGLEHLEKILDKHHGALIMAGHFTTMELAGKFLAIYKPFNLVYRKHKNPAFEWIMSYIRGSQLEQTIQRDDVRQFVRSLKKNIPIFYAPDQDYGRKHSVFVPFFGISTATITSTARITKMANTSVLPYFVHRRKDGLGYTAVLHPPLENYPTNDPYQDALRISQMIEQEILKSPEQYLWQHRRFKTRPLGESSVY